MATNKCKMVYMVTMFFILCLVSYYKMYLYSVSEHLITRTWPNFHWWNPKYLQLNSSRAPDQMFLVTANLESVPNNVTSTSNNPTSASKNVASRLNNLTLSLTNIANSMSLTKPVRPVISQSNHSLYARTMSCGLVLFTTFSPRKSKFQIHKNTIENWKMLVKWNMSLILFSNDTDLAKHARYIGWRVLPLPRCNKRNELPILPALYLKAMNVTKGCLYGYVNGDILFETTLLTTIETLLSDKNISTLMEKKPTLIVSRRTNVKGLTREDALDWSTLGGKALATGKLFMPISEDVFITTPNYPWASYPDIAIGVRAYDNWLLLRANQLGHVTIDVSRTLLAIHQDSQTDDLDRQHDDSNYNLALLGRVFGNVNYMHGQAPCAHYTTDKDPNGQVIVFKRTYNVAFCPSLGT